MTETSANNPGGGEAASAELASNIPAGDDIDNGTNTGDGDDSQAGATEPETEEVERAGQKFRIPKALKDDFLMHADFTRKTQDLAKDRETWTQTRQNEERAFREYQADVARVYALNDQLTEFSKVDWIALQQAEIAGQYKPGSVATLRLQYDLLKENRDKTLGEVRQKIDARTQSALVETNKQIEQAHAVVAREIKDWPQTYDKVKSFGTSEFALKPEEMAGLSDPRFIKVLHRAFEGTQAIRELAAIRKAKAAEEVEPLPQVSGNSRTQPGPRDQQSVEEWMRRRNQQTDPKRKKA